MSDASNPFAAPLTAPIPAASLAGAQLPEAESVRRELLKHEASIRSVGSLYYLGGGFLIVGGLFGLFSAFEGVGPGEMVVMIILFALGVGDFFVGRALRRLDAWVRIPAIVLSSLGLLWIPIGTIVNAYIIYLLACQKGARVLSPEYQEIVKQTPHIRYQTSIIVFIAVLLLAIVVIGGLVAWFITP